MRPRWSFAARGPLGAAIGTGGFACAAKEPRSVCSHYSPRGRQQRGRDVRVLVLPRALFRRSAALTLARFTHAPRTADSTERPDLFRKETSRTAISSRPHERPRLARPSHRRRANRESTKGAPQELSPMNAPPKTLASAIGRTPAALRARRAGHTNALWRTSEGGAWRVATDL